MNHLKTSIAIAVAVVAGAMLAPLAAQAVQLPHSFSPGDPVRAQELNDNFELLRNGIDSPPLHLYARARPQQVVPLDDQWHGLEFDEPEFDNTQGVLADENLWRFEVPEDGVYLLRVMLAGSFASYPDSQHSFVAVRAWADDEHLAEAISRADATCCVRRTTASVARWLEAGQLVRFEAKSFGPTDFHVAEVTAGVDITRLH